MPRRIGRAAIALGLVVASNCGESSDSTQPLTVTAAASTEHVPTIATDAPSTTDDSVAKTSSPISSTEIGLTPDATSLQTTSGTTEWRAPANAFIIGALPAGFVTRGSPQLVDAVGSPTGNALVSQTFINVGQHAMLVVSLETGGYVAQRLVSDDMPARTDIVDGTNVHFSVDANTGQQAIAWQAADDSVFWVYGTGLADDALFSIVRSLQIPET